MKCASSARSRRLLLTPSAAAADVESPGEPTEQQLQTNRLLMRADFGGLLDAVEAGASNFSAVNASTALIQLARGAGGSKGLSSDPAARAAVAAMADHLVQNAGSYGERALASSFHSLARMGQASNEVLAAVGEQVVSRPSGGISAQALDTIAWAWVWAGCGSDASLSDRVRPHPPCV